MNQHFFPSKATSLIGDASINNVVKVEVQVCENIVDQELETTRHSFEVCNPISMRSLFNPIEEAQESHQKFTNEDLVDMVATTGEEGEEKEEADDTQDGKVVATTTMAEKLISPFP